MTAEEKQIADLFKKHRIWFVKTNPRAFGGRWGLPDFIACVGGKFLAVECKKDGDKMRKNQIEEAVAVGNSGGVALFPVDGETSADFKIRVEKVILFLTRPTA